MTAESAEIARVRNARAGLLLTHPFFGVLSLKMEIVETKRIPTAGVDHKRLYFNPDFINTLTNVELKGLIAHEVMHLALIHHARTGSRDHKLFNIAADFALNPALIEDGFTLPQGALVSAQYKNMTAEAIYEKLKQMQQSQPQSGKGKPQPGDVPDDSQGWGDFDSAGPDESAEAQESAREWQENAAEALRAASSAGKLPAGIKRVVDAALAPKADWKNLTRRWLQDAVKTTSTWSKPNKRFYPATYLPGKLKTGLGAVAFFIDTSGSIGRQTLATFGAECKAMMQDCEPSRVYVIYCDAAVNHVDEYDSLEDFELTPHGGGGTDFRPPFAHAAAEGWELSGIIYLTDLMGSFPEHAPACPVLWASYGAGGAVAPIGETVAIDG